MLAAELGEVSIIDAKHIIACLDKVMVPQTEVSDNTVISSTYVHPHPIIEFEITNLKKDEIGYFAECVLYNREKNEVESSFFLDERIANDIINMMQSFLKICDGETKLD